MRYSCGSLLLVYWQLMRCHLFGEAHRATKMYVGMNIQRRRISVGGHDDEIAAMHLGVMLPSLEQSGSAYSSPRDFGVVLPCLDEMEALVGNESKPCSHVVIAVGRDERRGLHDIAAKNLGCRSSA